jgi:predicted secreted protein
MIRVLMALSLLALGIASVGAQTIPVPPPADDATVLHLSESAQRVLRQDRLTIQMRAEITGPDATKVQAEINRRMTAALERARAVPSVRTDARGYWVQQERPEKGAPQWRGVQTLGLTGPDSGALLVLTGELQQAGLLLTNLSYEVAPDTARAIEDELTAEALKRLRERVERVSATMGLTVRGFRDVRVGNVSGTTGPRPMMAMRMGAGAAPAPPPVAEPGETTVQVSVEADALLAPRARP